MAKQFENHTFAGMQRDVSASKHPVTFLYDAKNIRLTAREGDTLLSVTNERGTQDTQVTVTGTYMGHCLLNQYLVVFTAKMTGSAHTHTSSENEADYIFKIDLKKYLDNPTQNIGYIRTVLFKGNLNFDLDYPIDAIGSFESEQVQKVYWTDNHNQPRMINIFSSVYVGGDCTNAVYTKFDFVRELQLQEAVKVKKIVDASGEFPSGVIQYAFTYYDKYGQETNIFYTTPLLYVSPFDRGGRPDEKVSNSFQISIDNVDPNFDFLRIYSIQRTSINGTPICKRVQDMDIREMSSGTLTGYKKTIYVDNGFNGDTIDPTELLYKGGEEIKAKTIEQKDGTLFLGGITIKRNPLNSIQEEIDDVSISTKKTWFSVASRDISADAVVSSSPYEYINQLSLKDSGETVPCGGFQFWDEYRCGIQFQHKTGKWSDPIYIRDIALNDLSNNVYNPYYSTGNRTVHLLGIQLNIPQTYINIAYNAGYRRVRPVVVFPEMQDRNVICQGVLNPTVYTENNASKNNPYRQSSWFFRPKRTTAPGTSDECRAPSSGYGTSGYLTYTQRNILPHVPDATVSTAFDPVNLRDVEIEGDYKDGNKFKVDLTGNTVVCTFHSPDVEFDDHLSTMDFINLYGKLVYTASIGHTISDIDIQTETPTISNIGGGFIHKSYANNSAEGIVAGLFYDDTVVDDAGDNTFKKYSHTRNSAKWLVYPWQGSGSLNNDLNRPADKGTQTAKLKKKIISNLRYTTNTPVTSGTRNWQFSKIGLFSLDNTGIIKIDNKIYQGNIDTSLIPDYPDGKYFACNSAVIPSATYSLTFAVAPIIKDGSVKDSSGTSRDDYKLNSEVWDDSETPFNSSHWCKTFSSDPDIQSHQGIRIWCKDSNPEHNVSLWARMGGNIGDNYIDLDVKKNPVRMKYKSTPHLVITEVDPDIFGTATLPIVNLTRTSTPDSRFGGTSDDALMANTWLPCGKSASISYMQTPGNNYVTVHYLYGDTYYQRYDCLKTYPFTPEDPNQIVEIGSFMLETRVNIDGRYDRNRGQSNNLNMTPKNFNLMNPVYSQLDNFFNYKILDDDFYSNNNFPNQITWTKEKQASADVDLWTNVTLASTYDMDGSKGAITSLNAWKDQIFCFQQKGVSNILFNSRVQIPASDGVPIEISNSYKVDGYRYISDGIGCNDSRQIKETPSGIYFIDSISGHLHHVGDGIRDIAAGSNMTTWFREHGHETKRLFYDDVNHDLYVVRNEDALCFSELLSQFTSFMDYGDTSLIESYGQSVFTMKNSRLFKMFSGEYCDFFGHTYKTDDELEASYHPENKPWGFTFISNGSTEGMTDKIFTNLEFRACVNGDGVVETVIPEGETDPVETGRFLPTLPLDYIETWNEHQHGFANLNVNNGAGLFQHHNKNGNAALKRKFRIWRCDIPRDNVDVPTVTSKPAEVTLPANPTAAQTTAYNNYLANVAEYERHLDEVNKNISRYHKKPMDRMRNPWLFIKLQKNAAAEGFLQKTELHDMVVTYFG